MRPSVVGTAMVVRAVECQRPWQALSVSSLTHTQETTQNRHRNTRTSPTMAEQHPHAHDHHAHAGHGHTHGYAKADQEFFDQNFAMFERPDVVDATRRVAAAVRERYPSLFNAESTMLLDYACGTGKGVLRWSR